MSATLAAPPATPAPATLPGDGSFPAGTPIATPGGEAPVESLARGDLVETAHGPVAVRHATRVTADPAAAPARLLPVLVAEGAFGGGLPRQNLLMPPQQLVLVTDSHLPQGALAALGALVNGTTIRRTDATGPIDWVRLELEQPAAVRAAGLPVAARHDPTAKPAAPILPPGPAIAALRTRLAALADAAPAPLATATPEPEPEPEPEPAPAPEPESEPAAALPPVDPGIALHAVAGGEALAPQEGSTATTWHFLLPPGAAEVLLRSPPGLPATLPAAQRANARRYGVAIRTLLLDEAEIPLDGPAIGEGFHPLETAGRQSWRWTDGEAVLLIAPIPSPRRLTVEITDWHGLLQHD